MEDYIVEYNKIYARANEQGVVTHIFSEAFEQSQSGDICIDETNTDRHGANKYRVRDRQGMLNYEIIDGKLIERDKTADIRNMQIAKYPALVESKIRLKYTASAELAILRQRDTKPAEFVAYNAYCEQCKAEAKAELSLYE